MRPGLLTLAITLIPLAAFSQEIESLAGVRLTFDNPGARSLAMGSTGAANPASIAGAPRSFTLESRRRTMEGRYISDPQLHTTSVDSSTGGITNASFVLPMQSSTWFFFYDEPLNVDHSTAPAFTNPATMGLFLDRNGHLVADPSQAVVAAAFLAPATYPIDASLRLQRYGTTAAWSHGPLALGASARYERFRQHTAYVNFPGSDTAISPYFGTAENIDDHDFTYALGATWSMRRGHVAASYQSGGAFAGARTFRFDPERVQSIEFRTPASMRVGVAFDVRPQLTVAADAVRVDYSEMMHSHRSVFPQGATIGYPDVTELHAGVEYRIGAVALRGGWWRDPAHALSASYNTPPPMNYAAAIVDGAENHVTAGIGFGTKTRFDASIDRGTRSTRAAIGVTRTF